MKCFNLTPYVTEKKNTPNDWIFQYKPYGAVSRRQVVKRILNLYPDLKIQKVHVVKSLKKIKIIVSTNKKSNW